MSDTQELRIVVGGLQLELLGEFLKNALGALGEEAVTPALQDRLAKAGRDHLERYGLDPARPLGHPATEVEFRAAWRVGVDELLTLLDSRDKEMELQTRVFWRVMKPRIRVEAVTYVARAWAVFCARHGGQ